MVNDSRQRLDAIFLALSDPTRRAILERLAQGEASGTELARPFSISVPAISKHLRVLEHAALILHRKEGRVHRFRLAARSMREAWEPVPVKNGTKLLFGHHGFAVADAGFEQTRAGWEHFLGSLKSYLETGKGTPYMY